ncbi:MAG: formylglycine-generating enzyme family protein [Candidatus Contendobacter sp.]|nr:formylglycine-generating enzyme family protein [Candidatus Contendobacter sp.]MDS4057837.1 formylglycine-generating enzyme family protein [Candidatus Contendobacter sp.]
MGIPVDFFWICKRWRNLVVLTETLTFVSMDWIKPLVKKLKAIRDDRIQEINRIADTFGDPKELARYYVEPKCQHHNPADYHEDEASISYVKTPAFTTINEFLNKEVAIRDGRTQLFVLADAGMGKTSLLVMLKLTHLLAFWPPGYDCLLLKLGPDTLELVRKHSDKAKTVLLLDALDEDPTAWGHIEQRLIELLQETTHFRRVLISCRTQFFPETGADPFGNPGRVTVGGFICPMIFLSLFDDHQVHEYLCKRFPDPWHYGLTGRRHPSWLRAEQLLNSMRSLRFRPLLLAYIQDLLDASRSKWDEYAIYDTLTETWLLREVSKLARQGIKLNKEGLWTSCTAVAVYLQSLGKRLLSQVELRDLVAEMPAIAHIEQLDFGGRSLMNRTSDREYRFSHYSTQEFLVVHAIVERQLEAVRGICPAITQGLKLRATAQMLDFLRCRVGEIDVLQLLKLLDWSDIKLSQFAEWFRFQDRLRDGRMGPEMVVIPAGEFLMGSPADESERQASEGPQHPVAFARPFAMGRYAVTFEEYNLFCQSTGRQKSSDSSWGRGRRPVINVSWEDAVAYCAWLSSETGAPYRLPSEAEWEYAARGVTKTAFWWGDEIDPTRANYNGNHTYRNGARGEYRRRTVPVDDFQPNPFGLYQVHGNVWEWVQDSWYGDYQNAPADGSAWEETDGGPRVLRGGSWSANRWGCGRPLATGATRATGASASGSVSPGP